MTKTISVNIGARFLVATALALATFALPSMAFAATYAYVNSTGEVRTVTANTPTEALSTAPGISTHSGVLLLSNPSDGIVGNSVGGTK